MREKKNTANCPVDHGSAVVTNPVEVLQGSALHDPVAAILDENARRLDAINAKFNPVTGEGSVGERQLVEIKDFPIPRQWLPVDMLRVPLVEQLTACGSIKKFLKAIGNDDSKTNVDAVIKQFIRIRHRYDFPFWAATLVKIQSKTPGEGEILFRLTRPQRRFVERLEQKRRAGLPIRFVLLKARQWGGSTTSQLYMAWLQLVHKVGLNSVIISQTKKTSFAIKDMYDRALKSYPVEMLHKLGEAYDEKEPKMENVGLSGDFKRVPQRDCTITIASYEAPDALRGGAYSLVHCSEVGLWNDTDHKTPDDVVGAACSGVALAPYTMIIYESTAKGSGNFFHREYMAAKEGLSQFDAIFISWYDIDLYSLPFDNDMMREEFAKWLYENRLNNDVKSNREEPGSYLWWLWNNGATLEGIHWYINERKGKDNHAVMASEYPTDDTEAFVFSGRKVFDDNDVDKLKCTCRPPKFTGEIYGAWNSGEKALENLRFVKEAAGNLWMWFDVEKDDDEEKVANRYLVVVDVCKGMSAKADYAVIAVFDRYWMMEGGNPSIVAQWRGHIPMDQLAWKAAQIAEYYNHALLVIESNTLETNNTRSEAEYILTLIREVYDNLYARKSDNTSNDVREKPPVKYGFHTNVKTKGDIINNLQTVVREGLYTERDVRCLEEYKVYIQNEKGVYEAPKGFHDDILMTRAIGMWICLFEMDRPHIVKLSTIRQQPRVINEATM